MRLAKVKSLVYLGALGLTLSGCGDDSASFTLLAESDTFVQSSETANNKVDILWMIDGTGTMENHQTNLANNFGSFISQFTSKNIDYHMAVGSVDGWIRERNYNAGNCSGGGSTNPNALYRSSADCEMTLATQAEMTHFRDGDIYGSISGTPGVRSGTYLLTSAMNPTFVINTFAQNIRTGTRGDGRRESGFASVRSVLRRNEDGSVGYGGETHTDLSSFRRSDAFLAVIFVTDEEDQSRKADQTSYANKDEYTNAFMSFLDGYTGGSAGRRRYNVSSIVMEDIDNCSYGLNPEASEGHRYVAIANASGGIVSNICSSNFSTDLQMISQQILTLAARFRLSREPNPATIVVKVNGQVVPNAEANGWVYVNDSGNHYVEFRGSAIPEQGAEISVVFDPVAYGR